VRAVVIGSGTLGAAVQQTLLAHGQEVVTVGRTSGECQADISDIGGLRTLFARIGSFDAVANAAGDVFPAPLEQTTDEQWAGSIAAKGMGQINLVRAALPHIADRGRSPWSPACSPTSSRTPPRSGPRSITWWKDS
jgi:NAD(P)-dependent dehydrogenase (short-subunit alcohol dehydrogenase family)